jgi:putative FmdB family regulatory protein
VPIYEYQCKACGHVFEREHGVGERKRYRCPECSSASTRKLISRVGVVFKGTGFYITDSRKDNGKSKPAEKNTEDSGVESTSPASEN